MTNLFSQNLAALRERHPDLATEMEAVKPDVACYRRLETRSGYPSLEVLRPAGETCLWHSRYDPLREAERELSGLDHSTIYMPLFAGIGLGYGLRMLWDRHRDEFYDGLILERDPVIFRLAMETVPLADIFADPRVAIHVGEDWSRWHGLVKSLLPGIMSCRLQVIVHAASQRFDASYYEQALEIARGCVRLATAEFDLMIQSGAQIQKNLWLNLPPAIRSLGLNDMGEILKGQPAIVVAAGPSLDKNVHQLRGMEEGYAILVVDTALRTLLQQGIEPHIVVSTDPTELNRRHFENAVPPAATLLAFDPEVFHAIPGEWPHRRLFLNLEKACFTRWLEKTGGPYGYLPKGGSVGHTAFYLARALGADPIIFVGLDLAFDPEGGTTHASASALNRQHGKINPGESSAWLGPRAGAGMMQEQIVWAPGVNGEPVPTSQIMALYIRQFGEEFGKTRARLIDATEGGARLDGTELMPLRETLARFADPARRMRERFQRLRAPQRNREGLLAEIQKILVILELGRIEAMKGLRLCDPLQRMGSPGPGLRELPEWQQINQCFNNIYYSDEIKVALEQACFGAVYQFVQKERPEQTADRLSKYRKYFDTILSLQPEFLNLIQEVHDRIMNAGGEE